MIQDYVNNSETLNEEYIPLCATVDGQKLYEDTLNSVKNNFPQYVRELEGIADGCGVPFNKLFLLHMGQMIPVILGKQDCNDVGCGCSTICCNEVNCQILGHTEDAHADNLGHFYFVSAHIIEDIPQGKWKTREERFVSLCYPGLLPGFTMNYNYHGLVYTINVIHARELYSAKTPEYFLCRALLAAENISQVEDILRDKGCGSAVGFSVNATFLDVPGDRLFYNFEIGASCPSADESIVDRRIINIGEYSFHCNRYLRLKIPEVGGNIIESSNSRQKVLDELKPPKTKKELIRLLSHQADDNFTIFRDYKPNDPRVREPIATIAVGIFDCIERTWSIYSNKPEENEPMVVLPLHTWIDDKLNVIVKLSS